MYTKVDARNWKKDNIFDDVVQYFNRYSENEDIAEWRDTIVQHMKKYEEEIDAHIGEKRPIIDEKYDKLKKVSLVRKIFKILTIVFFVLCVFEGYMPTWIRGELTFGIMICPIVYCVFKIKEKISEKSYARYLNDAITKARQIDIRYQKIAGDIYNKLDDIYLNSLEPAHREVVLMRRDQERQHQELMQAQFKFQQEQYEKTRQMQQEQQKQWERLAEEQKRTRKAQDELLQIEREKERDRQEHIRKYGI